MSPRVYILLDVTIGKSGWVVQALRKQRGVLLLDEIEDLSRVVMVLEASSRQKLAELTTQSISMVESATEDVQLLPARDVKMAPSPGKRWRQRIPRK